MDKIVLGSKSVPYTLKRSQRKTIGLKIDVNGLVVSAPASAPLQEIESILIRKSTWILKSLKKWQQRQSTELSWSMDTQYPLLGAPWQIKIQTSGTIKMVPLDSQMQMNINSDERVLSPQQIEHVVMNWYFEQAHACFKARIAHYSPKLGVVVKPQPHFRLSRAKTRWGSCNSKGVIHLNWRLIQLPIELIDYVVAHELSHLIEMNHSPAFWAQVERIYPNFRAARTRLKEYG